MEALLLDCALYQDRLAEAEAELEEMRGKEKMTAIPSNIYSQTPIYRDGLGKEFRSVYRGQVPTFIVPVNRGSSKSGSDSVNRIFLQIGLKQ